MNRYYVKPYIFKNVKIFFFFLNFFLIVKLQVIINNCDRISSITFTLHLTLIFYLLAVTKDPRILNILKTLKIKIIIILL